MTAITEHVAALLRALADLATAPGRAGVIATVLIVVFALAFAADVVVALVVIARKLARAARECAAARRRVRTR